MKNIIKNIALLSLGAVLFFSSCTKSLEEINQSSNNATSDELVPTTGLLTKVQWNLAYYLYDEWQNLRQWGVVCQHFAQVNYSEEDRYQFRANVIDNYFYYMYNFNTSAQEIIDLATNYPVDEAVYGDVEMQKATATILKSWTTMMLCQSFGDIPYSEANQGEDNPTPKYDAQIDIFKGVISELTAAAETLASNPTGWSNGDMIYGGDSEKWCKFANSLRLQYAMRLSNYDAAYSKEQAAAAIAAGVFTSNDDNAIFRFTGSDSPNYHPMYESIFVDARDDYSMARPLAQLMKGENDDRSSYTNIFEGVADPRFNTYIGSYSAENGYVYGHPYGIKTGDNSLFRAYLASPEYDESNTAPVFDYDFWSTFLDYANVCFLQAEYNSNDKTSFLAGVQASLDQWAAEDGALDAGTYLADIEALFDAATDEQKLEMIITQKYIHNYGHYTQEAWFEYNRTGYPKSMLMPGDLSISLASDLGDGDLPADDYYFTALEGNGTDVATRLTYAYTEYTSNASNVNAAVSSIGGEGDSVTTPLIWQFNY